MNLTSRDPLVKKFLKDVNEDLRSHSIRLKVYKKSIDPTFNIQGSFCEVSKELCLIKERGFWLETLLHEYSHFWQWKTKDKSFWAYYGKDYEPIQRVEDWLSGKHPKYDESVRHSFNIIRRNEIECDLRALRIAKKYDLPIDHTDYRRKANAQLVMYHCIEHCRRWECRDGFWSLKKNKEMFGIIPSRFMRCYVKSLPQKLLETALEAF